MKLMRCLYCKYDLSHLNDHRCLECGRAFDPANRMTFTEELPDMRIKPLVFVLVIIPIIIFWLNGLQRQSLGGSLLDSSPPLHLRQAIAGMLTIIWITSLIWLLVRVIPGRNVR
jgi:hypothetical protein